MADLGPFTFFTTADASRFRLKKKSRILYLIICRYLPLLLICFALVYIKVLQTATSGWLNLLPVACLFFAAFLFMRNYTLAFEIREDEILITKQFFFSRKIRHRFKRSDLRKIELQSRYGKRVDMHYCFVLEDGQKEEALEFPLWSASPQRISEMSTLLSEKLRVPVEVISRV